MTSFDALRHQLRFEADRALEGCRLQTSRCIGDAPGQPVSRCDIDFHAFSAWRMGEIARNLWLRGPEPRAQAPYEAFLATLPRLKALRDTTTRDPNAEFLIRVSSFSDEVVRAMPGGQFESLQRVEYAQEAVETLYAALRPLLGELP
jgi:hypothetical protein